ncbi:MAG: shikimate kinase [Endomicrobiia bacterium]
MNIILTGFMCTGKTVVGLALAEKLNMEYINTDSEIEKVAGKKIINIFAENGEKFFRDLESKVILKVSKKDNCVISTGGGAVLRKENINNLRVNGKIINLTASPQTIFERLKKQNDTRPLLNKPDPMKEIISLMKIREEFYKNCDLQIATDNLSVEQIVEKILGIINN